MPKIDRETDESGLLPALQGGLPVVRA